MKNKRLQAIADCIIDNAVVADIGTDHAYLPCALIESGKAVHCFACDIAQGPLESARETIHENRLEEKIDLLLCPGLRDVPATATVAVIAGMGWMTAKAILENDFVKLKQFSQIVVQVNRDVPLLREWIDCHHFKITEEKVVFDRFYYVIVCFDPQQPADRSLSKEEKAFGPILLKRRDLESMNFYSFLLAQNQKIFSFLNPHTERAKRLHWQIEFLEKIMNKNHP